MDGNYATYQIADGLPIPFKRPCKSLCVVTTVAGKSCAGRLEGFGAAPDCALITVYGFAMYDSTNNPSTCNDLAYLAVLFV